MDEDDPETVVGEEFYARLHEDVDFDAAWDALSGNDHFFAEGMRGRVRSLQNRFEEAQDHYERAMEHAESAPRTTRNLLRAITVDVNRIAGHFWLDRPIDPRTRWLPQLPEEIAALDDDPEMALRRLVRAYPEIRRVLNIRRHVEGLLALYRGEPVHAVRTFLGLIEDERTELDAMLAWYYVGLGAAYDASGERDKALREFENAGFVIRTTGGRLTRANVATRLVAYAEFRGDEEEAETWRDYLRRLALLPRSLDHFIARGDAIRRHVESYSSRHLLAF